MSRSSLYENGAAATAPSIKESDIIAFNAVGTRGRTTVTSLLQGLTLAMDDVKRREHGVRATAYVCAGDHSSLASAEQSKR